MQVSQEREAEASTQSAVLCSEVKYEKTKIQRRNIHSVICVKSRESRKEQGRSLKILKQMGRGTCKGKSKVIPSKRAIVELF